MRDGLGRHGAGFEVVMGARDGTGATKTSASAFEPFRGPLADQLINQPRYSGITAGRRLDLSTAAPSDGPGVPHADCGRRSCPGGPACGRGRRAARIFSPRSSCGGVYSILKYEQITSTMVCRGAGVSWARRDGQQQRRCGTDTRPGRQRGPDGLDPCADLLGRAQRCAHVVQQPGADAPDRRANQQCCGKRPPPHEVIRFDRLERSHAAAACSAATERRSRERGHP